MSVIYNFPEDFYLSAANYRKEYLYRIDQGEYIAAYSSVLIIHMVRDAEKTIENNIGRMTKLGKYFHDYEIRIYEGDSTDNTKKILKRRHRPSQNRFVIHNDLGLTKCEQNTSIERRTIMAILRNQYLHDLDDFDYVIIYDDIIGGFSYYGVLNSLSYNYDVVGSNSLFYDNHDGENRRLFFDTFAFNRLEENLGPDYTKEEQESLNLTRYERGEQPFEVNSCFGGLAIYKKGVLSDCKYENWHCDHQTIHAQIRNKGGKIYLNPSQITLYNENYYAS